MRTVLAATAAGALILGSAAGAMAADPAPVVTPPPVVKIQKVDIVRHSPINVEKARKLKVRMTVRTSTLTPINAATVTLEQFTKKVNGNPSNPTILTAPITVPLAVTSTNADKSVVYLKGEVNEAIFAALDDGTTPALADGKSALLCISTATTDPLETAWSKQTMKRLNKPGVEKPVRECVKIYNPKAKPAKKNS
jgi:hypothetical protein